MIFKNGGGGGGGGFERSPETPLDPSLLLVPAWGPVWK